MACCWWKQARFAKLFVFLHLAFGGVLLHAEACGSNPQALSIASSPGVESLESENSCRDPILKSMKKCLHEVFGLKTFRGRQETVIRSVLAGKDTFAIMPTGAGKSLCYQLPAVLSDTKVTLVITPLLALMLGQVAKLQEQGILAGALYSSQRKFEREKVMNDLFGRISSEADEAAPLLRLLYVTPELLCTANFQTGLQRLYERGFINFFAVDEAHCVSEWGHEFRPSFRRLGMIHARFGQVPWLALTATATEKVKKDVVDILGLQVQQIFMQSFDRPNIRYQVRHKELIGPDDAVVEDLAVFISHQPPACTGIIYCHTKSHCDELAEKLAAMGLLAKAYHAGLPPKERLTTQREWMAGQCKVVCATIAFGMGIDKQDVRFVVHYTYPKSLEAFYQETGRAGRDGAASEALLYACDEDMSLHRWLVSKSLEDGYITPQREQALLESLAAVREFARGTTTVEMVVAEGGEEGGGDPADDEFVRGGGGGSGLEASEFQAAIRAAGGGGGEESGFRLASSLLEEGGGRGVGGGEVLGGGGAGGRGDGGAGKEGEGLVGHAREVGVGGGGGEARERVPDLSVEVDGERLGPGGGLECRRVQVLRHFGERVGPGAWRGEGARCCDVCCDRGRAVQAEKMAAMQGMRRERRRTTVYHGAAAGGGEVDLEVALRLNRGRKAEGEGEREQAGAAGEAKAAGEKERREGGERGGPPQAGTGDAASGRQKREGRGPTAKKGRGRLQDSADLGAKKRARLGPLEAGQTLMTAWCSVKPGA